MTNEKIFNLVFSLVAWLGGATIGAFTILNLVKAWLQTKVDIAKEKSAGATAVAEIWKAHKEVIDDIEDIRDKDKVQDAAIEKLKNDYSHMIERFLDYFKFKT